MLVRELITNSYYLSGLVSRDLQTVSGSQITDGLMILNGFLAEQSATTKKIPYLTHATITPLVGVEKYFISRCIDINSITFTIGSVRYSMQWQPREVYFGFPRANQINSLPYSYYFERVLGGVDLYVYFKPSVEIGEIQWVGLSSLSNVSLDDELDDVLDQFYVQFLFYSLAKRLCQFFGTIFEAGKDAVRAGIENSIKDINYIDFTRTTPKVLGRSNIANYSQVNLGRGFIPL